MTKASQRGGPTMWGSGGHLTLTELETKATVSALAGQDRVRVRRRLLTKGQLRAARRRALGKFLRAIGGA